MLKPVALLLIHCVCGRLYYSGEGGRSHEGAARRAATTKYLQKLNVLPNQVWEEWCSLGNPTQGGEHPQKQPSLLRRSKKGVKKTSPAET